MAVTIKDIAAKAGVSRGTVDRVLHNRKDVKPEVAKRILLIADKLGNCPCTALDYPNSTRNIRLTHRHHPLMPPKVIVVKDC